jgi:glycosyltransferase involved in cell wall biosynthesis
MRLAYFAQISGAPSSGVLHKVRGQTGQWQREGHDVRLFLLTRDDPQLWEREFPQAFVRRYADPVARFRSMGELVRAVRSYRPDLVYHRYFAFYPSVLALPRRTPIVVEVNTDDLKEYVLTGTFRSRYNRLTRGLVLGRARALVFVAGELSRSPSFARFKGEHVVITNGVDLSAYPQLPAPANDPPVLVFVGSPAQPWQGFDRVVRLAQLRPDWTFEIVGTEAELEAPANVSWLGPQDRAGVMAALARADVGIGTLALHRKQLHEASPLKVREYLAVGLPVLYAYVDPDADVLGKGVLRIANSETNVDDEIDRVDAFVQASRGQRIPREAVAHIDYTAKERQRLELFERLLAEG